MPDVTTAAVNPAQDSEDGPAHLPCEWCHAHPATCLMVLDDHWAARIPGGRRQHVLCEPCALNNLDGAREAARTPGSVWLYNLTPAPPPPPDDRWERLRKTVEDIAYCKHAIGDAMIRNGDLDGLAAANAEAEILDHVLIWIDENEKQRRHPRD